ncbi:MAG: hypothetical protein WD046_13230 [Paracoccaceae bacterium]
MPKADAAPLKDIAKFKNMDLSKAWQATKKVCTTKAKEFIKEYGKDDDDSKAYIATLTGFKSGFAAQLEKLQKAKTRDDQIKQAQKALVICKAYNKTVDDTCPGGKVKLALDGALDGIKKELQAVLK